MTDLKPPTTLVLIVLVSALVTFGAAASNIYLPSLPSIAAALQTSANLVQQTLSVFLFFFAISQLVYGPLSDRYGRKVVLLFGVVVYFGASIACATAESIEALLIYRVLQAFGACAGPVIGRAVVRDMYGPEASARILAYIAMSMMITPILAPIVGGWLETVFGWRANFVFVAIFGAVVLVAVLTMLPETLPDHDRGALRVRHMGRNYYALLSDSRFLGCALVATFGFCGIWAFITTSAFVFIDLVGLSPGAYGLVFASMSAGFAVGSFAAARLTPKWGLIRTFVYGIAIYLLGALVLNLLAFAGVLATMAIAAPTVVMSAGFGLVLANCQSGAIGPFPRMAGSASALFGFLMMGGAALVGALVAALYDGTQFPMVLSALIAAVCMSVAFYVLLWRRQPGFAAHPSQG